MHDTRTKEAKMTKHPSKTSLQLVLLFLPKPPVQDK